MPVLKTYYSFIILYVFLALSSCKKEHNTQATDEHLHEHDVTSLPEITESNNVLFYDAWRDDSTFVFEAIPAIEENIVYTDSIEEKEDYAIKRIWIMRDENQKIVKLKEMDELNDGSLRTILTAFFEEGELVFIEYLNDMIDEPTTSYFIKSAVRNNQFAPKHYIGKTQISLGENTNLPIDKASSECIFDALVLYDRMKDKYEK